MFDPAKNIESTSTQGDTFVTGGEIEKKKEIIIEPSIALYFQADLILNFFKGRYEEYRHTALPESQLINLQKMIEYPNDEIELDLDGGVMEWWTDICGEEFRKYLETHNNFSQKVIDNKGRISNFVKPADKKDLDEFVQVLDNVIVAKEEERKVLH